MLNWTSENAAAINQGCISPAPVDKAKPKRSALPVLVVLFLFAWGLMASLIVEQGRTIESQRWLIQSLFQDSSKLFQKRQAEVKAQTEAKAHSQVQTPSTQDKQKQAAQDPAKQSQARNHDPNKLRKPVPQKPPTDADTLADERRMVLRI